MQSSTLLQLLKSLDKKDMKELNKVVRSPYFNQREDVIILFNTLEKELNSKIPNLKKEYIFDKIYPKSPYDDVLMRQLMSYLYKITQKYLITENILNDEMGSQVYLIQGLRQRNIEKLIEKQFRETLLLIEKQSLKNANYHYLKYKIHTENYEYLNSKKRNIGDSLQEQADELDYFYIAECLRQACIINAQQTISKQIYKQPLLPPIINRIKQIDVLPISISAYFHALNTLNEPEEEQHFHYLKDIILNNSLFFPEKERRDLYIVATNYCIRRLNKGEKIFGKEVLELYQARLKNNVLLENGILPIYTYKNILTIALKSEEYEWAKNFLYDFKQYLPEKERENIFQYNLALYHFRTGDYTKSMPLLQKVTLNDVLYNLDARQLLARIYYELDEINALQSLIESSKIYLYRQKGIGYHHDMYSNYFRFLEKMMKIDMKKAETRAILRGEVENTQLLAEREWLIQKLS